MLRMRAAREFYHVLRHCSQKRTFRKTTLFEMHHEVCFVFTDEAAFLFLMTVSIRCSDGSTESWLAKMFTSQLLEIRGRRSHLSFENGLFSLTRAMIYAHMKMVAGS